jgi:hypothetical protein
VEGPEIRNAFEGLFLMRFLNAKSRADIARHPGDHQKEEHDQNPSADNTSYLPSSYRLKMNEGIIRVLT